MAESSADVTFTVNELLAYSVHYRNCSNIANLKKIILNFYTAGEITAAKATLLTSFPSLSDTPYQTGRRGSSSRPQHEAALDDIYGALEYLDTNDMLQSVRFVAANLDRLPKYGPEEINVCAVADKQRTLEANMGVLMDRLSHIDGDSQIDTKLREPLAELDKKLSSAVKSLNDRLDYTNTNMAKFAEIADKVRGPPVHTRTEADHAMNVILHGVAEDKDPRKWRSSVDDILLFIAGRPVEIQDAMRIGGRYRQDRVRPVLVKLRSIWDRRLLLSSRRKLKDYTTARVYINADESLEVRRQQTFDRLKRKAEYDGKNVQINGDVLLVDNVAVFSLQNGFLGRTGNNDG